MTLTVPQHVDMAFPKEYRRIDFHVGRIVVHIYVHTHNDYNKWSHYY